MKMSSMIRQVVIAGVLFAAQAGAAATINLYAHQSGHVWAGPLGQFDIYYGNPHIGTESFGTSRGFMSVPITDNAFIGATIDSIQLKIYCNTASWSGDHALDLYRISNEAPADNQELWTDSGDGAVYASSVAAGGSTGWKTITLSAQACADLQAAVAAGKQEFPFGLAADAYFTAYFDGYEAGASKPYFLVTYTPPPDVVTSPTSLTGPASGGTGQSLTFKTGGSTCNRGHSVQYQFDWGDGTFSAWSSSTSASHSWTSQGYYQIRVRARCSVNTSSISPWRSPVFALSIVNHTVNAPDTPSGSSSGVVGQALTFSTAGSVCQWGHAVQYRFDWGDGTFSSWSSSTSASHSWSSTGTKTVKAQARCSVDLTVISKWSQGKRIAISSVSDPEPTGAIVSHLSPPAAASAGATWRIDAGPWQSSGSVVTGIATGQHTVTFSSVSGWATPDAQVVTVVAGQTNVISAVYSGAVSSVLDLSTLYYAADETSGTTLSDAIGSNHGTLNESASISFVYAPELDRYCVRKSDSTTAGLFPASAPVTSATFSISCWARPAPEGGGQFFLIAGDEPEKTYWMYADQIGYQYTKRNTYPNKRASFTGDGGWHLYTWVNQDHGNGTATLRMYVDGVKLYDDLLSSDEYDARRPSEQVFLCQRPYSAFYYQYIGDVCNIAVFDNTALSDAQVFQLVTETDPRSKEQTSPIVFSSNRSGNYDIWRMNPDGSGLMQLTTNAANEYLPQWSPDGTKIAFLMGSDLAVMNADGSDQRLIVTTSDVGGNSIRWAPDGSYLVYSKRDMSTDWYALYHRINPDGTGDTLFLPDYGKSCALSFAPDGDRVVWAGAINNWQPRAEVYSALIISGQVALSSKTQLTSNSTADESPEYIPGTAKVLFTRSHAARGYDDPKNLHVMNADGTGDSQITSFSGSESACDGSCSPRGNQIAFVYTHDGNNDIAVMNVDGTGFTNLTNSAFDDRSPHWRKVAVENSVFSEDWESGQIDTSKWKIWGDPAPTIVSGGNSIGNFALTSNGDSWYESGVTSLQSFEVKPGLTASAKVFVQAPGTDTWSKRSWHGLALTSLSPAEWGNANNYKDSPIGPVIDLRGNTPTDSGLWVASPDGGKSYDATPYLDKWTTVAFAFNADGSVTYRVNGQVLYTTSAGWINYGNVPVAYLVCGGRSEGTSVVNLHDDIMVTQQPDSYLRVAPSSVSVPPEGGTVSFTVSANVSWRARCEAPWLPLDLGPTTGPGDQTVSLPVSANTGNSPRSATVTVTGGGITREVRVTQPNCYLTVPSSVQVPQGGGTGSFAISANVSWSVTDNADWLTVSPTSGSGDGSVTVNATSANTGADARNATVTVTGGGFTRTVAVTQLGAGPYLDVTPVPPVPPMPPSGGTITFNVSANVSWNVTVTQGWTATPSSGSGDGTFTVSASPNTGSSSISATIKVTGGGLSRLITVTQPNCYLTVGSSQVSVPQDGGSGTFSVSANVSWSVTDNADWLTVTPTSGSGDRTVTVNATSANTGTDPRNATVTVTGGGLTRTVTVTQPGVTVRFLWGDVNGDAVAGTLDASEILKVVAGLPSVIVTRTPPNPPAGDVDGNGTIGTVDASFILKKVAGLIAPTDFPADTNHDSYGPETAPNPSPAPNAGPALAAFAVVPLGDPADRQLSVDPVSASTGTDIDIPILIDNADGVLGFAVTLNYPAALADYVSVLPGSLTAGWSIIPNGSEDGKVVIAAAGATALSGSGSLCVVRLHTAATTGSGTMSLAPVELNDGAIGVAGSSSVVFDVVSPGARQLSVDPVAPPPNADIDIPILIDNADGVLGFAVTLNYPAALADYVSVLPGSLTAGWSMFPNGGEDGKVVIAAAGATALSGSGSLCVVRLHTAATTGSGMMSLAPVELNDGAIAAKGSTGIPWVPSAQPVLSVTPATRSVAKEAGNATFSVANTGSGTMNWTATVTSGGAWARITSGASGSNAGTITVGYDANPAGGAQRTATIRVTASGATGSPIDVTVVQAANFTPTYTLTVESENPDSGVVISSPTGHGGTTRYSKTVVAGETITLQAPEYVGSGAARKRFLYWLRVCMDGDENRTMTFEYDPENCMSDGNEVATAVYGDAPVIPCDPLGDAELTTTGSYDGYLYASRAFDDEDVPTVLGTLNVKLSNLDGRLTAKAVVQAGTVSFSGRMWTGQDEDGTRFTTLTTRGGETLDLFVRQNRIWGVFTGGKFGDDEIFLGGARNRFADRKDAAAQEMLNRYKGYYTATLCSECRPDVFIQGALNAAPHGNGYLTLTVNTGGKVRIAGVLSDGTRVSQSAPLLYFADCGECLGVPLFVPLYRKAGYVSGLLWIDPETLDIYCGAETGNSARWEKPGAGPDGFIGLLELWGGPYNNKSPLLLTRYAFEAELDWALATYHYAGNAITCLFGPEDVPVDVTGSRMKIARGDRPVRIREYGETWYEYGGVNPNMVTLSFAARTGIFRGNFTLYYDYYDERNRFQHKTVRVPYAGVMLQNSETGLLESGLGHCLFPSNDPELKAYRIKPSFPVFLW